MCRKIKLFTWSMFFTIIVTGSLTIQAQVMLDIVSEIEDWDSFCSYNTVSLKSATKTISFFDILENENENLSSEEASVVLVDLGENPRSNFEDIVDYATYLRPTPHLVYLYRNTLGQDFIISVQTVGVSGDNGLTMSQNYGAGTDLCIRLAFDSDSGEGRPLNDNFAGIMYQAYLDNISSIADLDTIENDAIRDSALLYASDSDNGTSQAIVNLFNKLIDSENFLRITGTTQFYDSAMDIGIVPNPVMLREVLEEISEDDHSSCDLDAKCAYQLDFRVKNTNVDSASKITHHYRSTNNTELGASLSIEVGSIYAQLYNFNNHQLGCNNICLVWADEGQAGTSQSGVDELLTGNFMATRLAVVKLDEASDYTYDGNFICWDIEDDCVVSR